MSALHQEFSSYADMLRFWLECLREIEGYNIFISLHPTMNRWEFAFLHEGGWWGFALAPPDTARMIALCDIYIASVSSTIRWAIACGKPVINYDVYRYRFPDFRPARGVVTVETKTDFISVLRRLTSDPEYYQALQQAQRESQAYWGTIDGQSRNRLFSLIDRLITTYQRPLAGESVKHSNSLARKLLPMRRAA
jgi:CDP-glycerol glycerophosphotransferase (TagB/SpsB family)